MQNTEFPMCCAARILCDFGGTRTSAGNTGPTDGDELRRLLKNTIRYSAKGALLVATTNSTQKVANKILRELGFSHSKWMSKSQHRGTKLRLWWRQAE